MVDENNTSLEWSAKKFFDEITKKPKLMSTMTLLKMEKKIAKVLERENEIDTGLCLRILDRERERNWDVTYVVKHDS